MELSEYAENVLQERFQTIPEVSSVSIFGQKRPAMRIGLIPINSMRLILLMLILERHSIEKM
jgi:multidrug efflux pump subunit AcrB